MTSNSATKNAVIVYRGDLLPFSETFIRSQVLALRRWKPILVGETRLTSGLSLEGIDSRLLFPPTLLRWHRAAYRLLKWTRRAYPPVTRQLSSFGAQLVHAHFGVSAVDIWPYAKALGLPMLVTLHGYDIHIDKSWWEAGNGGARMRRYPQELLALAKEPHVRFLAVSESIADQAVRFGIPRERIVLSYIGVDLAQFRPGPKPISERPRRVLYVGRFVEKKGVSYLIDAIGHVSQSLPDVELVLVGDGPLRESLEAQSKAVGGRITFKGALPSQEVHREMDDARVLCLPSITASNGDAEGLGLVIVEAQAAGLPVLTSARGGADEVVLHGVSGFRFLEKDVATLTMHLNQLLCDDNLLASMSRAAIENAARRFDIHRCIESVEDQYYEFLKAAK